MLWVGLVLLIAGLAAMGTALWVGFHPADLTSLRGSSA